MDNFLPVIICPDCLSVLVRPPKEFKSGVKTKNLKCCICLQIAPENSLHTRYGHAMEAVRKTLQICKRWLDLHPLASGE